MVTWASWVPRSVLQAGSESGTAGVPPTAEPLSFFAQFLSWGEQLVPSFVALLVMSGVLAALNRALPRGGPDSPSAGYRRQLVMLAVTAAGALGVLLALPLTPERLNGVLELIGLLFSAAFALSATTFVGNAMAGVMIRAVRNFKVGDFLQVGEHFGRVTERELFHTEIQTEDRDLLTLPNLHLITNPVKVVRPSGTILSATVSLGYDVPRDHVERLLVEAARSAKLDEPFVLVVDLLDHAVVYRASGLLRDVKHLLSARSRLRAAMLDALHAAGVEIVSPAFLRQRVVQLADEKAVIPPPSRTAAGDAGAALEELAFDKAEEVEDLESLRAAYSRAEEALATLDGEIGHAADDAARGKLEQRRARLSAHQDALRERIEAREASLKDG